MGGAAADVAGGVRLLVREADYPNQEIGEDLPRAHGMVEGVAALASGATSKTDASLSDAAS